MSTITPFTTVTSREIYGADITGLQDAVNRCEFVLGLGTAAITGHALAPVSDQASPTLHRRIYEGTIRGWLTSPAPVIRRAGVIVPLGEYTLYAGQGTVVFHAQQTAGVAITADVTHVTNVSFLTGHPAATAVHGATAAPTAERIIARDTAGRAQVAAPAVAADIARLDTVTTHAGVTTGIHGVGASTVESAAGAQSKVDTHNSVTNPHSATPAATPERIILRDAAGRAKVAAPAAADDIARQDTVTTHAALTDAHSATASATASRIVLRDAAGRAQVTDGAVAADIATWGQVQTRVAKAGDTMTGMLDMDVNTVRLRQPRTPASGSAPGSVGEICWDSDYLYICVATNTWRRIHSTNF